jgi:plastocyanin
VARRAGRAGAAVWVWGFLACVGWSGLGVEAGTIIGTVRAEGKPGVEAAAGGGNYASRKFKFVETIDYAALKDFVVYIDQPPATPPTPPTQPVQVVQKDARFVPHVLPVVVGTTVHWPNRDEIFHNVFSYSEPKRFDLDLYKRDQDQEKKVTFDKPGRVDVFCSIHSQMHCIVLVLENPHFAVADAKGRFEIRDVPAGKYRLKAWHERLPPEVKEIDVPATGGVTVDFVLGIKNLPKY